MNNSYNLSGFIDLLSTHDEPDENSYFENTPELRLEPVQPHRDELIDSFLSSSVLADINYTD